MEPYNRIKECRKNLKMTLVELGELSNIPRATLSRYENGNTEPKREVIDVLAKILGVSSGYLAGFDDDPIRKPKDEAYTTKEYKNLEIYKTFYDVGLHNLVDSDIFDADVLEAITNVTLSLGLLYSNTSDSRGIVTKDIIISVGKLINRLCFIGVGYEYTHNKDFPYILNNLELSEETVKNNRSEEIQDLNNLIQKTCNSVDTIIAEKKKNNLLPQVMNVLAYGENEVDN